MSFTNPKPGGYAFGEKLPSGHVNTVWANVANAVDGAGGGTYDLTTHGLEFTNNQSQYFALDMPAQFLRDAGPAGDNASWRWRWNNVNASGTIDVKKDIWEVDVLLGDINLTLRSTTAPIPTVGQTILVTRIQDTTAHAVAIKRESGTTICTFPNSVKSWARFMWTVASPNAWYPCEWGGGAVV